MERFWDLLAESVLVQGILTLGVTFSAIVALFRGITIPPEIWTLLGLAWGFYFGSKSQMVINANRKRGL